MKIEIVEDYPFNISCSECQDIIYSHSESFVRLKFGNGEIIELHHYCFYEVRKEIMLSILK